MMHHPNMHHQPMGGHPPQHMGGQMPAHHHPPPHQMHRDNRHVPMQRVAMGPQQSGSGMGGHGQPMGGMGAMGHHHAPQRPPHAIRAMHHPPQHHSMPPMKPMRRPYTMSSYPGVVYPQPPPPPPAAVDRQSINIPATVSAEPEDPGESREDRPAPPAQGGGAVANSKEKTPMCLVNELARYNKIKHQYRLTSETGPAHKKVFTVTLRLGENEEYTAEGSSIKRAQHAAANAALTQTRYPAPPPRAPPHHAAAHANRHTGTVMPTVELNALAMKICQVVVYTSIPAVAGSAPRYPRPPRPSGPPGPHGPPGPYRLPFFPPGGMGGVVYRVRVTVGGRAWLGEGPTPQAARHDAAARALSELRPPPDQPPLPPPEGEGDDSDSDPLNSEVKSPVSLVHELALKRNLAVVFTVKSERGPPHMRVFVTSCTVGDIETEGEGNGKKVSKRRAAERMLAELRRRWPPALLRPRQTPTQPRRRTTTAKKKPRNLIKESGAACAAAAAAEAEAADNPISRLAMARHAARARSPQYRVVEERGAARRREFLVRCDAPPHAATGEGPSKKAAKRRAALNVLLAMESGSSGTEAECANGGTAAGSPADSKRQESETSDGRQPVPGVLLMDYQQRSPPAAERPKLTSPAAPANGHASDSASDEASGVAPGSKDQLMYLSQLLGFTVQFSDFPKRNHGEYLSLVSLSTAPPVMCHGAGASTAASHEQCARAALQALSLMGLDAPKSPPPSAALSNGAAE